MIRKAETCAKEDSSLSLSPDAKSPLWPSLDETKAWERFLQGDDQSLIFIYRKYVDPLYQYGQQFSKRNEFVQDCIQELFFDLIDKRASLSKASSVKGYLFASLKRRLIRLSKKEDKTLLEEEGFTFEFENQPIPIHEVMKDEDYQLVYQMINQLPSSQREVIFLYFYQGFSYAEIAEVMEIKVGTARILTYRALDNLKNRLGPHMDSFYLLGLLFWRI